MKYRYLHLCLGLVPPIVVQSLMGKTGEFLMIVIILMAVTSTGSAEIMAVTSILVYDVYRLYLKVSKTKSSIIISKSHTHSLNCKTIFTRHLEDKLVPRSKPTLGTGLAQSNNDAHWLLPMAFSISHTELSILITHFSRRLCA